MQKRLTTGAAILPVLVLILMLALSASALGADGEATILVDGQQLSLDTPPIIIEGTTLVPMRAIFEAIGADVEWDQETKTATGTKGGNTVSVQIGNSLGYKNGTAITLLQPAQLINDRTLVPLRFISESLDCDVQWEGTTRTITITTRPGSDGPPAGIANAAGPFDVVRVVDGDTIIIDYDGKEERVRLIGVDTPESVHPNQDKNTEFGKVASDYTKSQLEGKEVYLEFDVEPRDRYDRMLAYVYLDGVMFNKTLLTEGMAVLATYPPNVKYVDDFTALQQAARQAQAGVWAGYVEEPQPTVAPSSGTGDSGSNASGKYYVTRTGSKYHYLNPCGSGAYYEATWEQVQSRGLEACDKCVY